MSDHTLEEETDTIDGTVDTVDVVEVVKPSPVKRTVVGETEEPAEEFDEDYVSDEGECLTGTALVEATRRTRIQLFVAALRSGRYRQVCGTLVHVDDGRVMHCALGVACEVAIDNGCEEVTIFDDPDRGQRWYVESGHTYASSMPPSVYDWYGLEYPYAGFEIHERDLTYWNDSENWSFEKIADGIEKAYDVDMTPEMVDVS